VSMNHLPQTATTAAAEPGPQACVHIEPWQTEASIRMLRVSVLPYQTDNFVMHCKTEM
jgi:hypothetical protein